MKGKKSLHHHRKKLRRHAFTSVAYLVAASLATVAAMSAWGQVQADEIIVVTAKVGGVVAGPTTVTEDEDDDDGKDDKDKAKAPASQPVVSVEPLAENKVVFSYVTDPDTGKSIPQFTTEKPAFRGETNIKNATIKLAFRYGQFRLNAFTKADAAGKWKWYSSEPFPDGLYHVDITAENPRPLESGALLQRSTPSIGEGRILGIQALASLDFWVRTGKNIPAWEETYKKSAQGALFDVIVSIPEPFRRIAPGDELVAKVRLIDFGAPEVLQDVEVEYLILDEDGNVITRNTETLAVANQLSFLKSFYTQPSLPDGDYELVVRVPSRNLLAVGSSSFTLAGKGNLIVSPVGRIDFTVVFQVLLGAVFIFIIMTYFEFMRFLNLKKRLEAVTDKKLKPFIH